METATVRTADQVDGDRLHAFLERFLGTRKARFLRRHGAWWHRGQDNRLVLLVGAEIAGYCAVIPTRCQVGDEIHEALWWMDLVIAPEFRGRRLESLLDLEVRRRAPLLLGFPNALAAKIHRQHSWGVREDLHVLAAPLAPRRMAGVRHGVGVRGWALRAAATVLEPAAALWRRRLCRARPGRAGEALQPTVEGLAAVVSRVAKLGNDGPVATTWRDVDHLRWRYLEAPYRDQLRFFFGGSRERPTAALILRLLPADAATPGSEVTGRILDLFGDLSDSGMVGDLVRLALQAACRAGAVQVTAFAGEADLARRLRRAGLVIRTQGRFCWTSEDREIMKRLAESCFHWVLGDSDNDEPSLP